jgi:hypothetical protein
MSRNYTLKELLQYNTVEDLKYIARATGASRYSRLKKGELIDLLSKEMLDMDFLQGCFLAANDCDIRDFERALKTRVVIERECLRYRYWLSLGLAAETCDGEINVPVEIEEKYMEIKAQKDYQEDRRRFRVIDSYAIACINLYSIIDKEKFLEILNTQTKLGMDEDDVLYWFIIREHYRGIEIYFYRNGYIMDECYGDDLFDETDDYRQMLSKQRNKPYYIPPKEELLKYAGGLYVERNPYFNKMLAFMKNNMGIDHEHAFDYCADMQINIRLGDLPSEVMNELYRTGFIFEDELQARVFPDYFMEMYNNTRMQENRGYTPNEMHRIMHGKDSIPPKKVIPFPYAAHKEACNTNAVPEPEGAISFGKVGRNDPCPCGSGKKYKNCCGRIQ